MNLAQLIYRALTDPNTHQALETGALTAEGGSLLPAQVAAVSAVLRTLPQQAEGTLLMKIFEPHGWESGPARFSLA